MKFELEFEFEFEFEVVFGLEFEFEFEFAFVFKFAFEFEFALGFGFEFGFGFGFEREKVCDKRFERINSALLYHGFRQNHAAGQASVLFGLWSATVWDFSRAISDHQEQGNTTSFRKGDSSLQPAPIISRA